MATPTNDTLMMRIGAVSCVLGSVMALTAYALFPVGSGTVPAAQNARLVADSQMWTGVNVGTLFAVLVITAGLIALSRSMRDAPGAAWARLGRASALVGTAIVGVSGGTAGHAMQEAARAAVESGDAAAWAVYAYVDAMTLQVLSVGLLIYFGVTFVLLGIAMAMGGSYPRWLGLVAIVGGLLCGVAGLENLYRGPNNLFMGVIFPIGLVILMAWLFIMGILLLGRAKARPVRSW